MLASVSQQVYTIARWDKLKAQERQDSIDMAGKTQMFEIGSNKMVQAFYYTREYFYLAELQRNPKIDTVHPLVF